MSQLRYVFYGGVEGVYQNLDDIDGKPIDPALLSPTFGASVGEYKEGQLVSGRLSLSGDALAYADQFARGTQFVLPKYTEGIDFYLQMPRVGGLSEEDLASDIRMTIGSNDELLSLQLQPSDGLYGWPSVHMFTNYAIVEDDNGALARIDGIWLPENIMPLVLTGTSGDNVLRGTAQYNFLSGGNGDDAIVLKAGQGWIWGGFGRDYIKGYDKDDFLFGGYGSDKILGRGGNDVIRGGDGRDELRGEQGNDTVDGGSGNDIVKGGSGNDLLGGQTGQDTILGNDGRDTIHGGYGNDVIDAGSGDDWVYGGWGNDLLKGGPGEDIFLFSSGDGGGIDTVVDFEPGQDLITIENDLFEDFATMLATYTAQVGNNVHITYGLGTDYSVIILRNIRIAQLSADDFGFSPNG